MTLLETLTPNERLVLIEEVAVGIFDSLIENSDPWSNEDDKMSTLYYLHRSGDKTISPLFSRMIELCAGTDVVPSAYIGSLIRNKFLDKWRHVYEALEQSIYSALDEYVETTSRETSSEDATEYGSTITHSDSGTDTTTYDTTKVKTGEDTDTTTYDTTETKTGDNSDVMTYNTQTASATKTGTNTSETTSSEVANDVYGFNSTAPVGDTTSTENVTVTTVGAADDNTSDNTTTNTGTESRSLDISESTKHTGTESKEFGLNETDKKTGTETLTSEKSGSDAKTGTDKKTGSGTDKFNRNGRNSPAAKLIESELRLRNTQIFYDIVFADIDSVAVLNIYC